MRQRIVAIQTRKAITLYGNNRMIKRGLKSGKFKLNKPTIKVKVNVTYKNALQKILERITRFFNEVQEM